MMNSGENNEPRNNEPAVVIQDLRKSFGMQTVLNGISLTVACGETLVVLGRNGTEKLKDGIPSRASLLWTSRI